MKRLLNILILFCGISFILMVITGIVEFECVLKKMFDIRCPGCGLTRSFGAIIHLDFYRAFGYNILGIPLFIIGVTLCIGLIIDIIKNSNRTIMYITDSLKKYYVVIIVLIFITAIINNINEI